MMQNTGDRRLETENFHISCKGTGPKISLRVRPEQNMF